MRRKDREMDAVFALEALRACEYATLATVCPDGTPYCVPISPVVTGNTIYFHCATQGRKLDNIARNPSVCVSCAMNLKPLPEKFALEYESAVAFGRCEVVSDDAEKTTALELICEKYAPGVQAVDAIRNSLAITGVCRITIENITGKANKGKKA